MTPCPGPHCITPIFTMLPLNLDIPAPPPRSYLLSGCSVAACLVFDPSRKTRVHVVPRRPQRPRNGAAGGPAAAAPRVFETDPFFSFHRCAKVVLQSAYSLLLGTQITLTTNARRSLSPPRARAGPRDGTLSRHRP
jgi:carotenoid cleavage dioxygenase-like enzyme